MDPYTDMYGRPGGWRGGNIPWAFWEQPQAASVGCQAACSEPLSQLPPAMAYVPWQTWREPYAPERGYAQGTIFPQLDLQFRYGRCSR